MDAWAEYQSDIRNRKKKQRNNRTPFQLRQFAAVDGEGVTVGGRHGYVLLRAGDSELFNNDGSPLSTVQCLDFLCGLDPDRIYVGFFFDYDVTKICEGLPPERAYRLVSRETRERKNDPGSYYPLDFGPYQLDYIKTKEFRVRKNKGPWVVISDVGSFFQCSFVKALQSWFPESEWEPVIKQIQVGKEARATFGGVDQFMRDYCALECNMLVRLMDKFRQVCYDLNLHPKEWQGPGRLVSAVLAREGYPRNTEIDWDKEFAEMCNAAYYGGRFEAAIFGEVPGPIYQYDINSAYPSVYRSLPCLKHGTWERFENELPEDGLYVADIEFRHKANVQYCAFPIRTKQGTLLFPMAGSGVYWSHEIRAALPYLASGPVVRCGFRYSTECHCDTFGWVEPMYLERKRLGKSGKGIVLKLALNSTYGKLCQSVGVPTFSNPVHASLITSHTRSQLYRAMMDSPDARRPGHDVVMVATDGIFTLCPRNLPTGSGLGEWEELVHRNIMVVQSGVYFIEGKQPKARGTKIAVVAEHEPNFRRTWQEYLPRIRKWKTPADQRIASVPVPVVNFISTALALARNKPNLAGQWISDTRDIAFEWFSKRTIFAGNTCVPAGTATYLVTRPQPGGARSVPYEKAIGGVVERIRNDPREAERWAQDTQPDWVRG